MSDAEQKVLAAVKAWHRAWATAADDSPELSDAEEGLAMAYQALAAEPTRHETCALDSPPAAGPILSGEPRGEAAPADEPGGQDVGSNEPDPEHDCETCQRSKYYAHLDKLWCFAKAGWTEPHVGSACWSWAARDGSYPLCAAHGSPGPEPFLAGGWEPHVQALRKGLAKLKQDVAAMAPRLDRHDEQLMGVAGWLRDRKAPAAQADHADCLDVVRRLLVRLVEAFIELGYLGYEKAAVLQIARAYLAGGPPGCVREQLGDGSCKRTAPAEDCERCPLWIVHPETR